jgi:hypothetical protein
MLTPTNLACATLLGVLLTALLVCVIGQSLGVIFAMETARALVGVRPI